MIITLNITEDSKVELIKDDCEAVQGESNVTELHFNLPDKIKGYSINNYIRQIEFGECKEIGECVKFFDIFEGNVYKMCGQCTNFTKIMVQLTLKNLVDETEPIVWKTRPFVLEFCESVNAEYTEEAQIKLIDLTHIQKEWQDYIKQNTFRVISRLEDIPTADEVNLGQAIFYLGENTTDPYTLTYGHYYRCNYVNEAYEWTDLTQDPSLEGVANGVREINKNQTYQIWVGSKEELENAKPQDNTIYIPNDQEILEVFDNIFNELLTSEEYSAVSRYKSILQAKNFQIYADNNVKCAITQVDNILNRKMVATFRFTFTNGEIIELDTRPFKIASMIIDDSSQNNDYSSCYNEKFCLYNYNSEVIETTIRINYCYTAYKYWLTVYCAEINSSIAKIEIVDVVEII